MKTVFLFILTAILLGLAVHLSGDSFAPAEIISTLFASGLLVWTVKQYERRPDGLDGLRPARHHVEVEAVRPLRRRLQPLRA